MTESIQAAAIPEIPAERGDVPFYRERGFHHPHSVTGTFRRIKWVLMALMLTFFHTAPFLRWDRGIGAPDQAILIDMAGRRAYFFFIEIWPQEVYYLTGLLLLAGILLFLLCALAGRVFCGFFCWQTVYTDLFLAVERWVIGDRGAHLEFDRRPLSVGKLGKILAVNGLWLGFALMFGIAFQLYLGDAFQTLREIFTGTATATSYIFIAVLGGFCFLLAGYARERVCVYMCPYARIQSAMFDEHSLIVSYEGWRGEPRGAVAKDHDFTGRGHCVDCRACVTSCPTGTDIRFGNQLSCIGCALCIDACNHVMDRFGLPHGLISYDSQANLFAKEKGEAVRFRPFRPRTMVYFTLLVLVGGAMVVSLAIRSKTDVNVLHERSPLYTEMQDGRIQNAYTYKILNQAREERHYGLKLDAPAGAVMEVVGEQGRGIETTLEADRDSVATYRIYVTLPRTMVTGNRTPVAFLLATPDGKVVRNVTLFAGPSD